MTRTCGGHATAVALRERVTALTLGPGQCLVVDLAGLEFCDSSGLTALLVAHNHAHAARADIVLTAVPTHTQRVMRVVGLDQVFTLTGNQHRPAG
ncbi:STAS domain-containing protein [Streptomyces sp. NRRL S-378]|uniref:STAS domain-containing protein n=1 Tax=Streptomyces sp. NRRL S-378 TaxID=1463904 RepID=UPI000691FEE2|nr:STAS domain-containing protein [Streptomyces sp. NRRL S-378]